MLLNSCYFLNILAGKLLSNLRSARLRILCLEIVRGLLMEQALLQTTHRDLQLGDAAPILYELLLQTLQLALCRILLNLQHG